MEPSSASPSWETSQPPISTVSRARSAAPSAARTEIESATLTTPEERRELAEHLADPLNRYYRYPAARALLRVIGFLPLRPDHITYIHTLCGITAGALVAFGSRTELALAFILYEVRMVLDCYDGVLARAKNLSSPRGRTMDELGDGVSYVALTAGMCVHVYRTRHAFGIAGSIAFGAVMVACGAMCGHAYDFYNRRFGPTLKEGRNAIKDELESKLAIVRAGNAPWITRFGIFFDRWQLRLYAPTTRADAAETIIARAGSPGVRALVVMIGLMSWENALSVMTFALLFDRVLETQLFALAYGVSMFTLVRVMIWRVLRDRPRETETA